MSSGFTMALAMPTTLKCTKAGGNKRLKYAVSAIQGYCEDMEDDLLKIWIERHHSLAFMMDMECLPSNRLMNIKFKTWPAVARYCANHLHIELLKQPAFHRNLAHPIERTFFRMDVMMRDRNAEKELSKYGGNKHWRKFRKNLCMSSIFPCFIQRPPYEGPLVDGCTACVALIRGNQIIIGNAGDSRCVLSRNGQAVALSTDHKQCLPAERQRIEKARNATVRVRGDAPQIDDGISTSRSIGDLKCKQNISLFPQDQILIAFPEVQSEEIIAESEFLVIACKYAMNSGKDCMTNQQVVDYVRIYLKAVSILPSACLLALIIMH
uniref:protein-serine/threonine phosphatase n=1 Tax=Setaria italica TaxID=4555 RepID=K4A2S1_SETIT